MKFSDYNFDQMIYGDDRTHTEMATVLQKAVRLSTLLMEKDHLEELSEAYSQDWKDTQSHEKAEEAVALLPFILVAVDELERALKPWEKKS